MFRDLPFKNSRLQQRTYRAMKFSLKERQELRQSAAQPRDFHRTNFFPSRILIVGGNGEDFVKKRSRRQLRAVRG